MSNFKRLLRFMASEGNRPKTIAEMEAGSRLSLDALRTVLQSVTFADYFKALSDDRWQLTEVGLVQATT